MYKGLNGKEGKKLNHLHKKLGNKNKTPPKHFQKNKGNTVNCYILIIFSIYYFFHKHSPLTNKFKKFVVLRAEPSCHILIYSYDINYGWIN